MVSGNELALAKVEAAVARRIAEEPIVPWYTLVSVWAAALVATIAGLVLIGGVALVRKLRS